MTPLAGEAGSLSAAPVPPRHCWPVYTDWPVTSALKPPVRSFGLCAPANAHTTSTQSASATTAHAGPVTSASPEPVNSGSSPALRGGVQPTASAPLQNVVDS